MQRKIPLPFFKPNGLAAILLMLGLFGAGKVVAQQVSIATGLPSSASSGSSAAPSVITFCINNTRPTPVTLKGIDNYMSTSNNNTVWKLFYSSSSLSGTPNVTTWTLIDSVNGPATISGTGIFGLFSSLSFSIPASTTYRFALQTTAGIINYGGATTTPINQTTSGIDLYRGSYTIGGSSVGYAGTASSPPFSPRFFCGTVYLDTGLSICTGTPATASITTPAMSPAAPLCSGSTMALAAAHTFINGITYQWQSGPSATGPWTNVTGGSGATTLSYTTAPITSNTFYRVGVTCSTSNLSSYSTPYAVIVGAPQPGAITGPTTFCPGNPITYSVPAASATTYSWTIPSGWTGTSTTNSITVTPGTGTGSISVIANSSCGTSIAQTKAMLQGSAPSPAGLISGNKSICPNTTQTYNVAPVAGAFSYIWTLPSGWVGSSTTNSITVAASSNSGIVTIKAINGCGQSSIDSLPVTVILALANPGAITGQDTLCSGQLEAYSVAPVPGATSYTWTLPSGWSGTTTGTSIQAFAGSASGTMTVRAYVACAVSPAASKNIAVVTTVNPAVSISVPAGTLCQGSPITITANPSFPGIAPVYKWMKNGSPVSAAGTVYTTNTLAPGDSVSVTMISSAGCASDSTARSNTLRPTITPSVVPGVSINAAPPIVICMGTPVTFTTASTGTGASPSYQWFKNNVPISGANGTTYTDPALVHGDTLTINMITSATCALAPSANSNKVGVTVNDIVTPTANIEVSPSEVVSPGLTLTFTVTPVFGGATPQYQWQKNGVDIPFETGDTYISSTLQAGDYITVKMISDEPCADQLRVTSNAIILKGSLGIRTAGSGAGSLKLYPNPTSGRFTVSASSGSQYSSSAVRIDVLNTLGQVVHHVELQPSGASWQTQVELPASLANGRYVLQMSSEDGGLNATVPFILNK
jgi:hypothetical protein